MLIPSEEFSLVQLFLLNTIYIFKSFNNVTVLYLLHNYHYSKTNYTTYSADGISVIDI